MTPKESGDKPGCSLYVYCHDVGALFQQAVAAGAEVNSEPTNMYWGDRVCSLIDPDGYRWEFAAFVGE